MVWIVTVVLLFLSSHTICTNPALKARVTQQALDYGRQVGMQVLQEELKKINIPDVSGSTHVSVIGKVHYQISGIRIQAFSIAQSTMAFSPGTGMKLSLDNTNIAIHGNWRVKYSLGRDSGSFDVSVNGFSVSALIGMSTDQTGRPAVKSMGCSSNVGSLRLKLHGGASWLYNLFRSSLEKPIHSALVREICPKVSEAINSLELKLQRLKVTANVDKIAEIDYFLVNPPVITETFMDLDFKGEFYNIGRHQEPPFTAGPLSFPEQTNHMMYLAVSEFFFNSAAFVYHRAGALQINITDSMIPKSSPIRLNTSTFGGFIPQLKKLYPEMLMLMKIHSLKQPALTMTSDNITIAMTGAADTFAILPNSSLAPLFVLNLDVSVSATPSLSGDKLTGSLVINRLGLSLEHSDIGPFETSTLQGMLNVVTKIIVLPKINAFLAKGYPLPSVDQLSFVNPTIKVKEKFLMIATDIKYTL
ncbi:bactericidal permeability-increasing protein-like precursor [Callorhinchus milii]|uniref:Bactericidal permeability-increasing protein n=1 Tax=Callorhinchus milii TaxID=7868 RepID=K4G078_CALMI|nr:bactericidal permeability-increasing protein-like precursor [Callorhinchus milii]AFK10791.1 Bactericidal permeability-increasing protein precursor [Callorhinchus milii]